MSKERNIVRKTHKKLHQMGTILPKTKRNKQMNPGKKRLLQFELHKRILGTSRGYTCHIGGYKWGDTGKNGKMVEGFIKLNKQYSRDFKLLRETQSQKLQDQFQVFQNLYHDLEQGLHTYHKNWGELPRLQKVG